MGSILITKLSGQSYKAPTIIIYISRVLNISYLLVRMTLESLCRLVSIKLLTGHGDHLPTILSHNLTLITGIFGDLLTQHSWHGQGTLQSDQAPNWSGSGFDCQLIK